MTDQLNDLGSRLLPRAEESGNMDMRIHQDFTKWATAQGVIINGVSPFRFPEKGLGLVANKDFEIGDTLVQVPITALRKATDVPPQYSEVASQIPVHSLLALSLDPLLGTDWMAALPTKEDMYTSMPLFWETSLQDSLPYAAGALLNRQKERISSAWSVICKAFAEPPITYEGFMYNYSIVNSRTFYYLSPLVKSSKFQPSKDDRLALNPFADYMNHSSHPTVDAKLSRAGYTLTASQSITQGTEIHISYGSHSNDFLLVEYGFILDTNRWDEAMLDSWIIPLLSPAQKENLEETGFLGKYLLDQDTICYRTQVVLRILCLPLGRWKRFAQGLEDEEISQEAADEVLERVLMVGKTEGLKMIERISGSHAGLESQRSTIARRWNQLCLLLESALNRIKH